MQAQKEAPPDMQCKDKFLVQSVIVNDGATAKEVTAEMVLCSLMVHQFNKLETILVLCTFLK